MGVAKAPPALLVSNWIGSHSFSANNFQISSTSLNSLMISPKLRTSSFPFIFQKSPDFPMPIIWISFLESELLLSSISVTVFPFNSSVVRTPNNLDIDFNWRESHAFHMSNQSPKTRPSSVRSLSPTTFNDVRCAAFTIVAFNFLNLAILFSSCYLDPFYLVFVK